MVDNTLGELVLGRSPSSVVKSSLSYLTRDPVRNAAAASSTRIPLEEIALIDPACGSGHILLYAFDLFAQAYELEGYSPREIPSLIIKNNLYGLEICPRAAQLAMFALMCKARQLNKNFFNEEIDFNICILSSTELSPAEIKYWQDHTGITFSHGELRMLRQFATHVEVAGSLIKPVLGESQIRDLLTRITAGYSGSDIVLLDFLSKAKTLLNSALLLSRKYHVVVANPPYLGRKGMNSSLRAFLDENYKPYRTDLFSAFIARLISFSLNDGAIGCMSPNVWMFIPSHEELRKVIVDTQTISTLVELPLSGFTGATVQICAFVLRNSLKGRTIWRL
jgi:type I restriction-modification system DNA methylase subunit